MQQRSFDGSSCADESMVSDPDVRWHGARYEALTWRDWGGEVVVFNQETGSTHLLGEFAVEVLARLATSSDGATIGALAASLADDPSLAVDHDWTGAINDALLDFARLGLAHRGPR